MRCLLAPGVSSEDLSKRSGQIQRNERVRILVLPYSVPSTSVITRADIHEWAVRFGRVDDEFLS